MAQKNLKEWDIKLPNVEFAYNTTPTRATGWPPFEALHGINPLTPIDLILLPTDCKVSFEATKRTKEMQKLHKKIRVHIKKVDKAYKAKANKNRKGWNINLEILFGGT